MQFIYQEFHTGGSDRGVYACMVQANVARENYTIYNYTLHNCDHQSCDVTLVCMEFTLTITTHNIRANYSYDLLLSLSLGFRSTPAISLT